MWEKASPLPCCLLPSFIQFSRALEQGVENPGVWVPSCFLLCPQESFTSPQCENQPSEPFPMLNLGYVGFWVVLILRPA